MWQNFVGEEKDLLACLLNWEAKMIASEPVEKGIKFKFNPPAALPHAGVWESFVLILNERCTPYSTTADLLMK